MTDEDRFGTDPENLKRGLLAKVGEAKSYHEALDAYVELSTFNLSFEGYETISEDELSQALEWVFSHPSDFDEAKSCLHRFYFDENLWNRMFARCKESIPNFDEALALYDCYLNEEDSDEGLEFLLEHANSLHELWTTLFRCKSDNPPFEKHVVDKMTRYLRHQSGLLFYAAYRKYWLRMLWRFLVG